jgi:glycosyltransferase involved in cell wall biosynthesis
MTGPARRPRRIAYLSFSSGEYDARTFRMARSAIAAGYEVAVYARWHPGLPPVEERDGYRLVRVPYDWQLAVPGLRGGARRQAAAAMAEAAAAHAAILERGTADLPDDDTTDIEGPPSGDAGDPAEADEAAEEPGPAKAKLMTRVARLPGRLVRRLSRRVKRPYKRWLRLVKAFPLRPLGWAHALEEVAEPADIWHGMWAGSLPALRRMRDRHGGRTIYDSRDVYMRSRGFETARGPGKLLLGWLERRWAHAADRVLTVNDSYAGLLAEQLGIARPPVVLNCPETWQPPLPRPDLIREKLGLAGDVKVVLYQGGLMSDRGIEQAMDAILDVPDAVLALLGFGVWADRLTRQTQEPPYQGRVAVLDPVPPSELLRWTASADVTVMAIQPTSVNHRYTTPQKLFESIAAGVPVVASDLPGMAEVVRASGVGVLCDPKSPAAIAAAIREVVTAPAADREALRAHVLSVAHDRYNWERQTTTLFELYDGLLRPAHAP